MIGGIGYNSALTIMCADDTDVSLRFKAGRHLLRSKRGLSSILFWGLSNCDKTIYMHRFSRAEFHPTALQRRHEYGFEDDVD